MIIATSIGLIGVSFRHIRGDLWKQKLTDEMAKENPDEAIVAQLSQQITETYQDTEPRAVSTCQLYKLPDSVEPLYKQVLATNGGNQADYSTAQKALSDHMRTLTLEPLTEEARCTCDYGDSFCASVGRKISLTKAMASLPKSLRAEIWAKYATIVSKPYPRTTWSWSKVQHKAIVTEAFNEAITVYRQKLATLRGLKAQTVEVVGA